MKNKYASFFITNIPSFYKLNLYNEINKRQRVYVLFTGDIDYERSRDFFSGEYEFDYYLMDNLSVFQRFWKTIRLLHTIKYDELIISGWDSIPLWVAALAGKKAKNSTVIESSYLESNFAGMRGVLKKLYMRRISKVYASGKSQVKLARKMGFKRDNIIVTKGVGVFNFIPQPQFRSKESVKNFIYVGRLSGEKNLEFLIRFFNRHPSLNLNIVGYGYQEKELKGMAHDNIHFLGPINNKALSAVYQNNDVFVLPSKSEAWGLVVEEALNNGLPVLLSNRVGCAEEILIEGRNGFSFVYDEEESLENVINKITEIDTYNAMSEFISKMNFETIEEYQVKCYLHE